jgi:hypothetical protein
MPLVGLDRSGRGPSGPCNHRRRMDKVALLATLFPNAEAGAGSTYSLGFTVENPSGKLLTAIAVGFAQTGGQGEILLPVASVGTWDLTPAFRTADGAPIPVMKVVDSTQANSTSNPTNLPNGWEVQTMAPLLIGTVTLNTAGWVGDSQATVTAEIGLYVCVSWEDVSGSFDPTEIAEIFAQASVNPNGGPNPPKIPYSII